MIVRELVTRLGFQTDTASLQKYEGAVDQVKRTTEKAASAMKAAFALVGVAGLTAFGRKLAEVGDRISTMKDRLKSLSQGGDFDQLADRARSLGAGMDSYIDGYIMLANATDGVLANQQEVTEILDTLNAGLKASGADAGTAAGVMRQFGQALGSGTLRGDELNSMNEGAGVLMRELARAILGPQGTVGALKKMAEQGKLTTEVVLAGMRKIGPGLRAQTEGMGRTVGQATQGLRDTIDRVIARFDAATGFTKRLADGLDWMSRSIERGIEFFGGMDTIVTTLGVTLGVMAVTHLPAVVTGLTAAARAAWAFMAPFLPMLAAAAAVFLVVQDLYSWIQGNDSVAGRLFGDFNEVADRVRMRIMQVKDWVDEVTGAAKRMWQQVTTVDGWKEIAGNVGKGVSDGASAIGGAVGGFVSDTASSAWASLKETFGFKQEVNATTTINVQGKADQATINEIGRVTERSVRGAASEAAKR
jgi:tape measure domain-containing protein|nr:MAG TPA: Tail tape measure [Caudoviricetes sp.]